MAAPTIKQLKKENETLSQHNQALSNENEHFKSQLQEQTNQVNKVKADAWDRQQENTAAIQQLQERLSHNMILVQGVFDILGLDPNSPDCSNMTYEHLLGRLKAKINGE